MSFTRKVLVLGVLSAMLAGCGTDNNDYECKMPGACAPVRMTYNNARNNTSWSGWSVDGAYGKKKSSNRLKMARLSVPGAMSGTFPVGAMEHPVYHPATPYMVWLAPYVTKNNHLHSSSLEWFTIPGFWQGPDGLRINPVPSRRVSGSNSGSAWHPLSPNEIGFNSFGKAVVAANVANGEMGGIVQPK